MVPLFRSTETKRRRGVRSGGQRGLHGARDRPYSRRPRSGGLPLDRSDVVDVHVVLVGVLMLGSGLWLLGTLLYGLIRGWVAVLGLVFGGVRRSSFFAGMVVVCSDNGSRAPSRSCAPNSSSAAGEIERGHRLGKKVCHVSGGSDWSQ